MEDGSFRHVRIKSNKKLTKTLGLTQRDRSSKFFIDGRANINKIRATIHPLHRAEPSNETQRVFACMTVCAQLPSANASQAYVSVDPAKGSVVELYD